MRNISTLIYLVDDINLPFDTELTPIHNDPLKDEFHSILLNLLEVDPGEDIVAQIVERIGVVK
jgi:hypothetical protein